VEQVEKTVLDVSGLGKVFGGLSAVNNVSFHINQGEILSMIGPNGAGKTTVFNCLTGVYPPTSGSIHLHGEQLSQIKPWEIAKKGICRTFQITSLFWKKSVLENMMMAQYLTSEVPLWDVIFSIRKTREIELKNRQRAQDTLRFVGLEGIAQERVENLSLGDQKRTELAMALVRDPLLLMLDEPTAGLNPSETARITELIRMVNREKGITVFFIEHDMKMVMGVSQRIIVLDTGEKIAEGTPEEIRNNERVIEAYLGRKRRRDTGA
jgi:branched-chain amino acid transport system ATP-binding protein